MEPTEISSAIGALKEAGIISIIEGGYLSLIKDDTAEFDRLQEIIEWLEKAGEIDLKSPSPPLEKGDGGLKML